MSPCIIYITYKYKLTVAPRWQKIRASSVLVQRRSFVFVSGLYVTEVTLCLCTMNCLVTRISNMLYLRYSEMIRSGSSGFWKHQGANYGSKIGVWPEQWIWRISVPLINMNHMLLVLKICWWFEEAFELEYCKQMGACVTSKQAATVLLVL